MLTSNFFVALAIRGAKGRAIDVRKVRWRRWPRPSSDLRLDVRVVVRVEPRALRPGVEVLLDIASPCVTL